MARNPRCILIVCNDGAYFLRHRRHVAERLVADGFRVHVLAGGEPIAEGERHGWTYGHVPIERFAFHPLTDLKLALAVRRFIRSEAPSALHLITLKPVLFGGLAAIFPRPRDGAPQRLVMTIPGLGRLMGAASGGRRPGERMMRALVAAGIRFLSARRGVVFTFESGHDRDLWVAEGMVGPQNSVVIAGAGVDPAIFFPVAERAPGRPLTVLFASRLLRAKGLDSFLDAARAFSGRHDIRFVVAGMIEPNDPDGISPETLAAEPAITFAGEIKPEGMAELLRQADLVCLPTRYGEGIPRILIEAAASGVAAIASDFPGCREIVHDGENGTLLPLADAATMAAALQRALAAYLENPSLAEDEGREGLRIFRAGGFEESAVVGRFVALLTGTEPPLPPSRPV